MEPDESRIERVKAMETHLDVCCHAARELAVTLDAYEAALPQLKALADYYSGGLWLRDYQADEAGCFPPELKRGVLSQDALSDLLDSIPQAAQQMERLIVLFKANDLYSASM